MTSIEREIGNFQARMENVESELQAIRSDMRELRDAIVGTKAGWRLLVFCTGFATAAGALLERYLPLLSGGPVSP